MALSLMTLIAACLFLIGCGGNGGGSSSGGGGGSSEDPGRLSIPTEVELSISPFDDGLHIQWQNLSGFERAGGIYLHLNLTSNDSPPRHLREKITIAELTDNNYNITGLINGTAYRLVEVRVELAGDVSRVVGIDWLWQANDLDNNGDGIVVGVNYDGDGRVDWLDEDMDGDGVNDTYTNGTVWDLCGRGELGWLSNRSSDFDGDGCRDEGTVHGGYGEDTDDDNDGVEDGDEVADVCRLNPNCDNDDLGDSEDSCPAGISDWSNNGTNDFDGDGCRDRDEDTDDDNDELLDNNTRERLVNRDGISCSVLVDCDNDGVEDGDEVADQCVIDTDCDNDGVEDGDEVADQCVIDADCDNDGVEDGDEVADQCVIDADCDNDGVEDGDEVADQCVIDTDCDNDELLDNNTRERLVNRDGISCSVLVDCDGDNVDDGDEVADRCVIATDCDNDKVEDGDEVPGCTLERNCDNDDLGDSEDSCPAGLTDWNDDGTNDMDSDGCRNDEDVDDDGDGLIEIGTAEELDAVRWVLNGTGFKADEGAMLNQSGCGDGVNMTVCNGYELVGDIVLTDYITDNYPIEGWLPIAHDINISNHACDGDVFGGNFDGNGFEVRGLFINRTRGLCIGLFGQVTGGTIRHLGVIADRIMGGGFIGGLMGRGRSASIVQSYVVSSEVRGRDSFVGGLVGIVNNVDIVQSYAVSGELGIPGWRLGGLVGSATDSNIIQSYAVSNEVIGIPVPLTLVFTQYLGGLVGQVLRGEIVQSYAVSGEIRGDNEVGGLIGFGAGETVMVSYWDAETSSITNDGATGSSGQTTSALRSPTGYTGIYATWDDGAGVEGINDNTTIWCDEDLSGVIETDERRDNNKVWDFGTATDYPALRCTPDSLTDQRAWWSLTDGDPQLDQTRLNTRLNQ